MACVGSAHRYNALLPFLQIAPAYDPARRPRLSPHRHPQGRPRTVARHRRHVAARRMGHVGAAARRLHRRLHRAGRDELRPRRHLRQLQRRRPVRRSPARQALAARTDGNRQQVRHQAGVAKPSRAHDPALRHQPGTHTRVLRQLAARARHGLSRPAADPPSRPLDGLRRSRRGVLRACRRRARCAMWACRISRATSSRR